MRKRNSCPKYSFIKKNIAMALALFILSGALSFHTFAEKSNLKVVDAGAYDETGAEQLNPDSGAELAADQNEETFWTVFADAVRGYITLDLGGNKVFNTISILDKKASISEYAFEYSADGTKWEDVAYGSASDTELKVESFPPIQARYVRLNIYKCKKDKGFGGFSIAEIDVYNDPANKLTAADRNRKKTYKDVIPVTAEGKAIEELSALHFISGYDDGCFRPNAQITRAEFALMLTNILKDEMKTETDYPFTDVDGNDQLKRAVSTVYKMGIMIGDTGNTFRPNDSISAAEAIKTMVALCGYDSFAQASGGYFDGYLIQANRLGILKNINIQYENPITRGNAALLIANSFDVKVMGFAGVNGNNFGMILEESEETMLNYYSGIYRDTGVITATNATGLDNIVGSAPDTVEICSKDIENWYRIGESNAEEYLGYHVNFYYEIDDDTNILKCVTEGKNTVLTINADDIEGYDGRINYENGNGKIVNAKLTGTAPVIINGIYSGRLAHALTENDFNFTSGYVKLIDNDGSAGYDVVMIVSYINGIVSGVSENSNTIVLKGMDGIPFDVDYANHKIIRNGEKISVNELVASTVVSAVVSSNEEVVTVIVSPFDFIEGMVRQINEDSIYIDETEYKLCDAVNFNNLQYLREEFLSAIKVGTSVRIYVNIENKVVGALSGASDLRYGYLYKVYYTPEAEGEEGVVLKILTQTGKMERFLCAEKVKLNNGKRVTFSELNSVLTPKQPIRFSVDADNKIQAITLPDENRVGQKYENDDSLIPYGNVGEWYNQRWLDNRQKMHSNKAVANSKEFIIDNSTICFMIPDKANEDDERLYDAKMNMSFSNGKNYDVNALNVTKFGVAKVALIQVVGGSVGSPVTEWKQPHCLVTKVCEAVNADNEAGIQVTVIRDGQETAFFCDVDTSLWKGDYADGAVSDMKKTTIDQLKPGAVIIYDDVSNVKSINLKYPICADYKNPDPAWSFAYSYDAEIVFGKVLAKEGNKIVIQSDAQYHYTLPDVKLYAWNAKTRQYSEATAEDILAEEDVGSANASYIYYSPYPKAVYIFNY